jgi:hypothetical protein
MRVSCGPASTVRASVAGGLRVAREAGSLSLLGQVRAAYAGGLDVMLGVCVAAALLGLAFLPRQGAPPAAADPNRGRAETARAE